MFDQTFFRGVLPDRVRDECAMSPEGVPVVLMHLGTGAVLDLCHIVQFADTWMACRFFRDAETCDDMDVAFVPYGLVTLVTVSLRHAEQRRLGFERAPAAA